MGEFLRRKEPEKDGERGTILLKGCGNLLKTLYLLRHGETEWNDQWRLQGQKDTPLSPKGILQAEKAAKILKNLGIDFIYCSDLNRAAKTSEIIAQEFKGQVQVYRTEKLREISFGDWEGKKYEEFSREEKEYYQRWLQDPVNCFIPGGESLEDVKKRVMEFIASVLKKKEKNILLVSHGGPIKIMISQVLSMNLSHLSCLAVSPASLSLIQYYENQSYLVLFNDVCHLADKK